MKLRNVIFYVSDMQRSIDWYVTHLNLEIVEQSELFSSFKTDDEGAFFSLNSFNDDDHVPGHQCAVFHTSNIEEIYKAHKDAGLTFELDLSEFDYGKTYITRDPDGNRIEFVQD